MLDPETCVDPRLDRAIEVFLLFKQAEGITPRTLAWYADKLGEFCRWLGALPPYLSAISAYEIAEWIVAQQKRGLSPVTIEGSYRALLAFCNWCEYSPEVGFVASPIGHGHHKAVKRPKVDEPLRDYVTFEEYIALTAGIDLGTWLDYRDWCLIGVMFWCGVRRGELLGMDIRDVDYAAAKIRIRHSKSRHQRSVFLIDDLVPGIRQYLALRPKWDGTSLWTAYDKARIEIGGPLTATGLRMMLIRRCRRAGIRFLHPHLFRHGFAMAYLNHGVDLKAVGDMMGHSSYRTTEKHYARWIEEPLQRLHQRTAAAILGGIP